MRFIVQAMIWMIFSRGNPLDVGNLFWASVFCFLVVSHKQLQGFCGISWGIKTTSGEIRTFSSLTYIAIIIKDGDFPVRYASWPEGMNVFLVPSCLDILWFGPPFLMGALRSWQLNIHQLRTNTNRHTQTGTNQL